MSMLVADVCAGWVHCSRNRWFWVRPARRSKPRSKARLQGSGSRGICEQVGIGATTDQFTGAQSTAAGSRCSRVEPSGSTSKPPVMAPDFSITFAALMLTAFNAGGRPPTRPERGSPPAVRVRSRRSSTANCQRAAEMWRITAGSRLRCRYYGAYSDILIWETTL